MDNPLVTYFLGIFTAATLIFLFLRRRRLALLLTRRQQDMARVRLEDALKHTYDCEERGLSATVQSVAGALEISTDEASGLASGLEQKGLLQSSGDLFSLTTEGRAYALRVVRVHRLWERYLADETSVRDVKWHHEAEKQEHRLTPAEVEALAAHMGNPQFDPHGDPIPSASGILPVLKGQPLTTVADKAVVRIVHIEDEPPTVYAQLAAQGLHTGMQINMLESRPERILFEANGEESVLAPLLARNITVEPLPEERQFRGPFRTLASVRSGERAIVQSISRACRGAQRRRLMDMGIVPGTPIEAELDSLTGDPVAYRVRGTLIALRRQQADQILVRSPENDT
jgi:DtxR family transcriptional regulator, Mn-dependent transcriptional regulator